MLTISINTLGNSSSMALGGRTLSVAEINAEWSEIQAAQEDIAKFRPLYERYYEAIFRFVYKRTCEEGLSAELTSNTFLKAMEKIKSYHFKGVPFSAWLFRIASNEVNAYFRTHKKKRIVSVEDYHFYDLAEETEQSNNEEIKPLLLKALGCLKEQELQLIEMRFFEHRPFKEIADILGITESNAKVKTYRTLEKMKKNIQKSKSTS